MTRCIAPLDPLHRNLPRRACVDALQPAELRLRIAMSSVEALGADPLLTDAVVKISEAQTLVSDWLEGGTR